MAIAVGEAVVMIQNQGTIDAPPLHGWCVVTGPPAQIVWQNGTRTTLEDVFGVQEWAIAAAADVDTWMNATVERTATPGQAVGTLTQSPRDRGVVVDVFLLGEAPAQVLTLLVRRPDGLYYVTPAVSAVLIAD